MKKRVKITCLIAVACIALGSIIVLGASVKIGFDYKRLNTETWESKTYTVEEPFQNIDIESRGNNVYFAAAEDGQCKVVATETERQTCTVSVENGTLTVKQKDTRRWYETFGFFWGTENEPEMKITVYLPLRDDYGALQTETVSGNIFFGNAGAFGFQTANLSTNSGDIAFSGAVEENLSLYSTSGDIACDTVQCAVLSAESNSGKVELRSTVVSALSVQTTSGEIGLYKVSGQDKMDLESNSGILKLENTTAHDFVCTTTSGDIFFKDSDAHMLDIKSNSGCIDGNLLTPKNFEIHTNSGEVDVPHSDSNAGLCTVNTTNGDISLHTPRQ